MCRGPGLLFPGCLLVLLAIVVTGQIPEVQPYLESDRVQHLSSGGTASSDSDSFTEGSLDSRWDTPASEESTANLIFESVGSLLQTWGNTRRRNGHAIIPATLPIGTTLYHGRRWPEPPSSPEWLALNSEFSYIFTNGTAYMHIYVATRDLRLVHFDGSSASKLASGSMDVVDLLIWNKFDEGRIWDEYPRIAALCEWGKRWGIDGYVRMQMDFEVMMCDFEKSVELVSSVRIIPPSPPIRVVPGHPVYIDPVLPPGWRGSPRSYASMVFEVIHSGSWQNHRGGEMRLRVDFSRFITFFDPKLKSLVKQRKDQTREQYRVKGISTPDLESIRSTIDSAYSDWDVTGSGVDWSSIIRTIQDRYAQRLELINNLLQHGGGVVEVAVRVREQILTLLTPYISFGAYEWDVNDRSWVGPVAHLCSTTLTKWIVSRLDPSMTPSERLIRVSIEDVQHEICRVVSEIWADAFAIEEEPDLRRISGLVGKWRAEVRKLMEWLDWPMWVKCSPRCDEPREMCYLPMWPWVKGGWGYYEPDGPSLEPKCIPRLPPYPLFLDDPV